MPIKASHIVWYTPEAILAWIPVVIVHCLVSVGILPPQGIVTVSALYGGICVTVYLTWLFVKPIYRIFVCAYGLGLVAMVKGLVLMLFGKL